MEVYKSPKGYFYLKNKNSNQQKRISKEEYLKNKINNSKKNHPKMNHPKIIHPKMNHPKMIHPKMNHPKMNNQKNNNGVIVLFYGDWCGHCHHIMPEWQKFMKKNKDNKIKIMKIESSNEPVMRKHEIRGFPTIRYLPNGLNNKEHVEFQGNRHHTDLERFLKSLSK
jgi:thiol-disulfide isomerase/thioredoxin